MLTKAGIERYFIAEKQESLIFMAVGVAAMILAIVFFFILKSSFFKGASIPLIAISLIQIMVGYSVYARSDEQRINMVYAYDMEPSRIKSEELSRMKTVNKKFIIYRYVEIALAVSGLFLLVLYRTNAEMSFWFGLGLTLCIQSLFMLGADYFAEKRAKEYTKAIEWFAQH